MPVITTTGRSFAQTARDILTNTNISANAFKLYCLAFTFPKNWKFVRSDLQLRLKFGSANTVKKAVLELVELGLVTGSFTTDLTFYDHSIRSDSLLNSAPDPDSRYISVQPDSTAAHYPPVGPLPQENDRSLCNVSLRSFFRPINVSALDANGLPVSISDSDESFFDPFSSGEESFFDHSNSESQKMTNSCCCFINNTNKQTNKQQRKFSKNDQEAFFDPLPSKDVEPMETEMPRKETAPAESDPVETDPPETDAREVIPPEAVPTAIIPPQAVPSAVLPAIPQSVPPVGATRSPLPERTPPAGNPFAGNPQQASRSQESRPQAFRPRESSASKIDFSFLGSTSKFDFARRGDESKIDFPPGDASENDFSGDQTGQNEDAAFSESVRDAGRIREEVEKRWPGSSARFQTVYERVSRILWCPGIFTEVLVRATCGLILGLKGFTLQEFEWLAKRADRESQKNGKQKWQMVNLSLTRMFEAQTPAWTYPKCKPGMALRPVPQQLRILPPPVPSNYAPSSGFPTSGGQKMTFPRPKEEEEEDLYDDSPEEALAEAEAAGIDWEIDGYDQMVNKVAKYLKITNINAAFRIRRYRDAMK